MSRSRWYTRRYKNHDLIEWKRHREDLLHAVSPRRHFYKSRKKRVFVFDLRTTVGAATPGYRPTPYDLGSPRSVWLTLTLPTVTLHFA